MSIKQSDEWKDSGEPSGSISIAPGTNRALLIRAPANSYSIAGVAGKRIDPPWYVRLWHRITFRRIYYGFYWNEADLQAMGWTGRHITETEIDGDDAVLLENVDQDSIG